MNGFALAYELATDNAADLAALLLSASATDYVSVSDSSADGVETATKLSSLSSYRQESSMAYPEAMAWPETGLLTGSL